MDHETAMERLFEARKRVDELTAHLRSIEQQCGNVISNCEQRPADNDRHLSSWKSVRDFAAAATRKEQIMSACAFCGRDPYEYVDVGVGSVPVAVTCCELGCAVYDHRNDDDAEIPVTSKELREMAAKVASLEWQVERRDRTIGKLWKRRTAPAG